MKETHEVFPPWVTVRILTSIMAIDEFMILLLCVVAVLVTSSELRYSIGDFPSINFTFRKHIISRYCNL